MNTILIISSLLIAYLLGSFPTSIVTGKLVKRVDVREHGSGNAGATNTVRVLGAKWGLLVGLIDLGKGWAAVYIASQLGVPVLVQVLAGVVSVIGHAFPVFAGFRGGKGVATGAGMILGLFPLTFVICLGVFLLLLFTTGTVSVSSMAAAITLPLAGLFTHGGIESFRVSNQQGILLWIFTLLVGILVIFLHRKNIGRIIRGEERRFEKIMIFRRSKTHTMENSPDSE